MIAATLLMILSGMMASAASATSGRLIATGGVGQIEGAAGGGLVPWAVLAGYGTRDEWGGSAYVTQVDVSDYSLRSYGVAVTAHNRIEVSLARQSFDLGTLGKLLGMRGAHLRQDVLGLKWRVFGDAVYSTWPQLSVGVQHKRNLDFALPQAVGAKHDSGNDFYVAATKVFLAGAGGYNLLTNLTLRSTEANQFGLLGFGGDRGGRSTVFEGSLALLLRSNLAFGAEYRQKPDNLGFAHEDNAADGFVAWFPNKHLSVTAAWVDLGSIAGLGGQRGWYLSLQGSF